MAQEAVAAEKEHGAQYRRIAEVPEKERDEQLRLSAQFKASTEAKLAEAEAARAAADERLQGTRGGESAIREEATTLRTQLAEARRAADEATERARQAALSAEEAAAAHASAAEALKVQLTAAKEEGERSLAKYRQELFEPLQDMQAFAAAKEGHAAAERARAQAEVAAAEAAAALEAAKASFEERASLLSEQLKGLEERHANAAKESALLHTQLQALAPAAGAAAAGGADGGATELLAVMRRDKELLSRKNELLTLEVQRLGSKHEALTRQHQAAQAKLAESQAAAAAPSAAAAHEQMMGDVRELALLRDSNSLMRAREEQRDGELSTAREALKAAQAEVEPLRRAAEAKERENARCWGGSSKRRRESERWQVRAHPRAPSASTPTLTSTSTSTFTSTFTLHPHRLRLHHPQEHMRKLLAKDRQSEGWEQLQVTGRRRHRWRLLHLHHRHLHLTPPSLPLQTLNGELKTQLETANKELADEKAKVVAAAQLEGCGRRAASSRSATPPSRRKSRRRDRISRH